MKRKKVLIDTFCLVTASTGIRTYTIELCKSMDEFAHMSGLDFEPSLSLERMSRSTFLKGKLPVFKKIFHHLAYFIWKQIWLPLIIIFKRVDVVICPDFVVPMFCTASLKLAVVHDAFFWELPTHYNKFWRTYYLKMVALGLSRKAKVVTTSQYAKGKLKGYLKTVDIEVIYQCPKPLDQVSTPSLPMDFDFKEEEYILHIGYFDKRKNLQHLVKSFDRFIKEVKDENIKLVLAGGPATSPDLNDYDNVIELVAKLNLQDRVSFLGFVPDALLSGLYKNALFYVFPSYDEGFGIPVIEAMNSDLPVIVSDKGALREVGSDAVLIFQNSIQEDLQKKMVLLYQDVNLREILIAKGKLRAKEFSRLNFFNGFKKLI